MITQERVEKAKDLAKELDAARDKAALRAELAWLAYDALWQQLYQQQEMEAKKEGGGK